MRRAGMALTLIGAMVALLVIGVAPAHAADCPEPHDMISVTIDVKPGSDLNPVNLKSEGVIPVALLGSATFSVADVDLSTVRLHPMGRCEQAIPPVRYAFEDVNGDGYRDIIFHFVTKAVGFRSGDTAACLHGNLSSGEHFCGHDTVVIIGY